MAPRRIEGLVLCRVGPFRLALRAASVTAIGDDAAGERYAGELFAPAPARPPLARVVRSGERAFAVDSVAVRPDSCSLLEAPFALLGGGGRGLEGFADLDGELWPVLSLSDFDQGQRRSA